MATGLIGALRITLGIDMSEFQAGSTKAQAEMRKFQREFAKAGKQMQAVGRDLSTFITAPIIAMGVGIIKTAGDFEAGMNRVSISTGATATEMKAMREQALAIGSDTAKSASEAADAMDMLAKAGMPTKDILSGGAKAAVNLALATGSELDPAASAVTDTMAQFHKTAAQLPDVINKITGAVNESKFSFGDFQGGMAQAGGIASSAGVSFDDFTTALAGTASQFASGSDAGTSFKTFIQRMIPQTKEAASMMEKYGLTFYDAQGRMKSMSDIAQMLQDKMSGLSAQDRNAAFSKIFGTDAIRTAIGLMQLGSKGFEDMQARIAKVDAVDQASKQMRGFNGQLEQLKGALETLAIRIADSGLLEAVTGIVVKMSEWVDWMAKTSPETLKMITIIAALAAALGPLTLVFGTAIRAVGLLLPLIVKLGPLLAVLKSGIGYLIPVIAAMGRALLTLMLNPIGLVITAVAALYLAWKNWDKIKPIIINLYNTVKAYVLDGLNKVWAKVEEKINAVKGWFFGLYDAVVGHSYIPDMVDEIGQHMSRLDALMVQPVKKGTAEAKQAFQQLQQEANAILSRLYPEQAAKNQLARDIETVTQVMKAQGATADELADALTRLRREYLMRGVDQGDPTDLLREHNPGIDGPVALTGTQDGIDQIAKENDKALDKVLGTTEDKTARMAIAWADMAASATNSLRNMVADFKSGDILGGITSLMDTIVGVSKALRAIGLIGSLAGGGGYGSGAGMEGASDLGFSTGGSFKVGGVGGVDSQLMRFRASPGEIIDVRRGDQQGRRDPVVVQVVANDYFDAKVQSLAAPMVDGAATRGALGGAALAARNNAKANRGRLG